MRGGCGRHPEYTIPEDGEKVPTTGAELASSITFVFIPSLITRRGGCSRSCQQLQAAPSQGPTRKTPEVTTVKAPLMSGEKGEKEEEVPGSSQTRC